MVAVQHEKRGPDRILPAARALFADHGFHQTAMAELATEAQVSVGQIYRHFKGKDEIIDAIVKADGARRLSEMQDFCERLKTGEMDVDEAFRLLVTRVLNTGEEALSFDILAEASRNESVGRSVADLCAGYRSTLREFACIANPALSGESLEAAEEVIMACLFGLGHRSLSMPTLSVERTAALTARMILSALRAMD